MRDLHNIAADGIDPKSKQQPDFQEMTSVIRETARARAAEMAKYISDDQVDSDTENP